MFVEESRHSETRPRNAVIHSNHTWSRSEFPYDVVLNEHGRLIKRTKKERARSLTEARKIAKEWCR